MTYTKDNLPKRFLTPPIRAIHPLAEEYWARNWSIFAIATQWGDNPHGMLTAIARWVHQVDPSEKQLTRQRIQYIRDGMARRLWGYSNAELGLEDPDPVS